MKKLVTLAVVAGSGLMLAGCAGNSKKIKVTYPETRMDSTVVDDYHGTPVADPYRWLEDDNSAETAAWVAAQNEVTFGYLARIPYREQVKARLTELWNYPKQGAPTQVGEYYFFSYNDGLQNQSVVYRQKGLDGTPEVFLDPNKLSEDGTVALGGISFSKDDKIMGYTVSASGSDWSEIHFMDVETGAKLEDVIRWVKFSGMSWDREGFYYSRYDEPDQKSMLSAQNRNQKVCYHKMGTPQSADRLVYTDFQHPLRYFHASISDDCRYLFVEVTEGTRGSEILYKDLTKPGSAFKVMFPGFEYDYGVVECVDDKALVYTNENASNYRLVEFDLVKGGQPVEVIAEAPDKLLQGVSSVGGYLVASYLEKAMSKVYQMDFKGQLVREVELPGMGTAGGFGGKQEATETFYSFANYLTPSAVYRYDLASGSSTQFSKTPEMAYDPALFTFEQVFYPSKDGTQVSMFVLHRKDIKFDGKNPCYLYGYGGFNSPLTPGFNPSALMFVEQGGVFVVANLRGGNEYGEKWHRDGMLDKKQNVFDDFIAAAEYLIDNKYTSSKKLAIAGGSNGGLLVGACMVQRPELVAVAFPAVGVMDMLRYHKFTVGWGWAVEYGCSEDPAQFAYLYKYSPLHNIKPGVCYPATLVTTADHDDRVVPAHSFKFAATLQAAQGCDNPCLIRIDTKAGHGAGKPTAKRIEEAADVYSFLFWNTGSKVSFK